MSFKPFSVLLLCTFAILLTRGQGYNRDSIAGVIARIRQTPVDTGHIRQLRDLAYEIGEADSALSKEILLEALDKSFKIKDARAITNSYRMLGMWYSGIGDRDQAMNYYWLSRQTAKDNQFYYLEAGAYFNMGNIKYWKGEYDSSIDYFLKTQMLFENQSLMDKDPIVTKRILDKKKSDLYATISAVFNTLGNLPKADEYINKALAIAESYQANTVIAMYTQQKADNYAKAGQTEQALRARLKHLPAMENGGVAKAYLQPCYQNISEEYYDLDKIDSAKIFAQKSLATAREMEVPDAIAHANWQMGRVAMKEHQYALAEDYLKKSAPYFLQSEDPNQQRSYHEVMHQLLFATGKFKEAYEHLLQFQALNDTILGSERAKQFSEREARYQSEKKDARIQLQRVALKQKTTLNLLLAGSLATLLVIGLLTYRNYKNKQALQKQRIQELETEKQLAATESVLKGEEQERTRLAKDLHDGLGGMLSGIKYTLNTMKGNLIMTPENAQAFERSMDMLDSSIQEMRRVAHNMMPEVLVRYGLDAALKDYVTEVNKSGMLRIVYQSMAMENREMDRTSAIAVYRIVQELINNVIKHAGATEVLVQLLAENNKMVVNVEDNGKGFEPLLSEGKGGMGWKNIRSRVELLKGTVDIQSAPGKGTAVNMEFNLS